MNSKKVWSLLLLVAISFSVMHDYAFTLLNDEHCSIQEYVDELSAPSSNAHGDTCDIHFEYHITYILPAKLISLTTTQRVKNIFVYNEVLLSWNYFNFFKPPIV